jgi:hypothetical protein
VASLRVSLRSGGPGSRLDRLSAGRRPSPSTTGREVSARTPRLGGAEPLVVWIARNVPCVRSMFAARKPGGGGATGGPTHDGSLPGGPARARYGPRTNKPNWARAIDRLIDLSRGRLGPSGPSPTEGRLSAARPTARVHLRFRDGCSPAGPSHSLQFALL